MFKKFRKIMSLDSCSDIQKVFKLVCYCKNSIGYELQLLSFKDWRNGRKERKEQEEEWKREGEGKELERKSN